MFEEAYIKDEYIYVPC